MQVKVHRTTPHDANASSSLYPKIIIIPRSGYVRCTGVNVTMSGFFSHSVKTL